MSSDTNTTALKISLRARTYQLYWSGENSGDNFFLFFSRWKVKTHSWHSQVFETGLWIWSQLQREGNFKRVRKKFQEGEVNMERSVHEDVRPLPLPLAQGQAWTSRYDCHSCAKKDLENHLFIKFDQILLENDIWRQNISTFTSTKSNVFYMKSEFSPALSLSSPCEASTSSCRDSTSRSSMGWPRRSRTSRTTQSCSTPSSLFFKVAE